MGGFTITKRGKQLIDGNTLAARENGFRILARIIARIYIEQVQSKKTEMALQGIKVNSTKEKGNNV